MTILLNFADCVASIDKSGSVCKKWFFLFVHQNVDIRYATEINGVCAKNAHMISDSFYNYMYIDIFKNQILMRNETLTQLQFIEIEFIIGLSIILLYRSLE